MGLLSHLTVLVVRKEAHYHLSLGISANGYPVSDNKTLNGEGGETAMGYPLSTYTMCTSHKNPQLSKVFTYIIRNLPMF